MSHWNWKKGACCFGVWSVAAGRLVMCSWVWVQGYSWIKDLLGRGGGHYFSYNLLNEIQTMFSQLAQRSWVLPADWRPDYAHYVKKHRLTVLRRNKNIAVLYFCSSQILSLFRHSVSFSVSVKEFSPAEFGICNIWLRIADKNHRRVELSSSVICCKP